MQNSINERFKIIRTRPGLTQQALVHKTGLSQGAVNNIENRNSSPTFQTLESVVNQLNVNPLYLFGMSENMFHGDTITGEDLETCERVSKIITKKGISVTEAATLAGVSAVMLQKVASRQQACTVKTAVKLAKALSVPFEWLAGEQAQGPGRRLKQAETRLDQLETTLKQLSAEIEQLRTAPILPQTRPRKA